MLLAVYPSHIDSDWPHFLDLAAQIILIDSMQYDAAGLKFDVPTLIVDQCLRIAA
jgi:hypothetical protein